MAAFDDRLEALRERFIVRSRTDRIMLIKALAADDRTELQRIAHSLAGAGGLFGHPEISDSGQRLEDALDEATTEDIQEAARELLRRLEALDQPG
ncbi:MAG TPA: Hpt domain-containing protein [Allosphingosinicella sp.]|nr:Hpt domain-containing protein [Allosphingosinicella sp.]